MKIYQIIDDFLFSLFNVERGDREEENLIQALKEYYTTDRYTPEITIENGVVIVEFDANRVLTEEADYKKAIAFCEKEQFDKALPILKQLIKQNPTISEYHRNYGQVESELGNQDAAINSLIDALKYDRKNKYALLMLGNIYAKYKNDSTTAKRYYDLVLEYFPEDYIALNNIGAILAQTGDNTAGMDYLMKAYAINKEYPNNLYGIALLNINLGNDLKAFDFACQTMKHTTIKKDQLYGYGLQIAFNVAQKYLKEKNGKEIFERYKKKLEDYYKIEIRVEATDKIPTKAKVEQPENYGRSYYLLKYQPNALGIYHLLMHELTHVDFILQARVEGENKIFFTSDRHYNEYKKDAGKSTRELIKLGLNDNKIEEFHRGLHSGMALQMYNTPIDLFIEQFLYSKYEELRPIQFASLVQMTQENFKSVNNTQVAQYSPQKTVYANKVLCLVGAIQVKDLFGISFINDFKPTKGELDLAAKLYDEYYEYRNDRTPGEEYELILHWGEDLEIDSYFGLKEDDNVVPSDEISDEVDKILKASNDYRKEEEFKKEETQTFLENEEQIGTNMAVAMYMVDALQHFEGMDKESVKKIALEIAMLGTRGINPDVKDYKLNGIPNVVFTGYKLLAYYYVSFAIAIPELLKELCLPYDEEYKIALGMIKK